MKKKKISVIGAPIWHGQPHFGVQYGPDALRLAGLAKVLRSISGDVVDCANAAIAPASIDKPVAHNIKHLESVSASAQILADKVADIVAGGRFPLVLGGDHSIALGSLAGIAKHYNNLGVIWYDAHADINTPATSPSGNIHGMPLAASMGLGHPALTGIGGYCNKVKPENIVMIGIRDIDPGEVQLIKTEKIKVFSADDVAKYGALAVIEQATAYLADKCDGIHLSFDLDALDPGLACGVGTPAKDGLELEGTFEALRYLYQHNVVTSADIVELNPLLDRDGKTARIALGVIQTLLSGNIPEEFAVGIDMAG